jgi:polyhydroxybutyrate depolymerase
MAALALATGLLACGESPVRASYEGEDWEDSFMQVDFTRFYRVHVPDRPEVGPAAPLVLAFHGVGQDGTTFRARSGLDAMADQEGFIVVYLEAAMGAWDIFGDMGFLGLDDLAYVREVITRVSRRSVIDEDRIIAVGLSNGGVFSQQLACRMADRLAGFVSVSATMPRRIGDDCHPSRPISAHYVIGTDDSFFPIAGTSVLLSLDQTIAVWANANGCSGGRNRTAVPDRHDDGTTVFQSWYRPCDNGTWTAMDSIVGGGHVWPGGTGNPPAGFGALSQEISANARIAAFLRALPRN